MKENGNARQENYDAAESRKRLLLLLIRRKSRLLADLMANLLAK